jgi:hypothetical protein
MERRKLTWALLTLWAGIYAWSFIVFQITEPTGDSFTRGLNRVTAFLGWQVVAGIVAIAIWRTATAFPKRSLARWLGRLPATLAALLFAAIVGLILYARLSHPPPPAAEVTRPIAPPVENGGMRE